MIICVGYRVNYHRGIQFVSGTHKLKIVVADGKQYNSDALLADDIIFLAKRNLLLCVIFLLISCS